MAFPTVQSVTTAQETGNVTTHDVVMPATVTAGDLLIVIMAFDGNPTVTWDSTTVGAWQQLFDVANSTTTRTVAYYKYADGTEDAADLDIISSASEESAWQVYRITGHDPATPPEAATATGNSTTPNPPSLNPASWGTEDTLWIACFGADNSQTVSAYPTNYSDNQSSQNSGGTGGTTITSCTRNLNGASDDPGTFTQSASEQWVAATIAVRTYQGPAGALSQSIGSIGKTMEGTVTGLGNPDAVFPEDWTRRAPLVIQQSVITGSGSLSNFQVLLTPENLPTAMLDADGAAPSYSDGRDIRFTSDSAGTTELPFEIVSYATHNTPASATAEIWVRVPSVSTTVDTTIYVWWRPHPGKNVSAYGVGDTYGRNATWSGFTGVFHGDATTNSTGGDGLTASGSAAANSSTSKIGKAFNIPTSSYFTGNGFDAVDAPTNLSISCWARPTNEGRGGLLTKSDGSGLTGWWLGIDGTNEHIYYHDQDGTTYYEFNTTFTANTWYHVAMASTASARTAFKNGATVTQTANFDDNTGLDNAAPFRIGQLAYSGGPDQFVGQVDEVRIAPFLLDVNWYQAEYANANSPSTFVVPGTVVELIVGMGAWPLDVGSITPTADGTVGGGGINGALAKTLDAITSSAAGNVLVNGALAATIANFILTSDGDVPRDGALSATLGAVTSSAAGGVQVSGALSASIGSLSLAAAGTVAVQGALSATIGAFTLTSDGDVPRDGAASITLGAVTLTGAGTVPRTGDLASTLGAITSSAVGNVLVQGELAQSVGQFNLASDGDVPREGSLSASIGTISIGAEGVVGNAPLEGSLSQTITNLSISASGQVQVQGSLSQSVGSVGLSGAGQVAVQGQGSPTIDPVTSSASGRVDIVGVGGGSIGLLSLAALGVVEVQGQLNQPLGNFTGSFVGSLENRGSLSQTLGDVSAAGAGTVADDSPTLGQTIPLRGSRKEFALSGLRRDLTLAGSRRTRALQGSR